MTEKEKMLAQMPYLPYDSALTAIRARAKKLIYQFNQTRPGEQKKRLEILKTLLGGAGEDIWIEQPFFCDYGENIFVGDRFFSNYNCTILDCAAVTIGNNVMFGPGVSLYTAAHPLNADLRRSGYEYARPITIGDDVWVGGSCVILPGVTIGNGSVIGAGSVVTKSVPAGVLAVGNPCRVLREITEKDRESFQI